MSRAYRTTLSVLIVAAWTVAAVVGNAGRVAADPLSGNGSLRSASGQDVHTPAFRLGMHPDVKTQAAYTFGSEFPAHVHSVASGALHSYLLSAIQLPGQDGDWVALAGLGRPDNSVFGRESDVPMQPLQDSGFQNWFYTVEMIFVPRGRWSIGAGLSIDADQLHDALTEPLQRLEPLHFNIFLMLDFGVSSKMALDLGYGRLPVEAYAAGKHPGLLPFDSDQQDAIHSAGQVYSACLNIQF